MADHPGCPCPPAFSWNAGMVLHILKGDLTLRDLEHVQVDGPSMVYLFFYDKQDCRGLKCDAAQTLQTHVVEAFSEWISHSALFVVIPLPLVEGWRWTMATLDRCHQRFRAEYPDCPVPNLIFRESDSMPPLVGSAPPSAAQMGQAEETGVATLPGCPPHSQGQDPPKHAQ